MSQVIDTATAPRVCRDSLQTAPQGLYRLPGFRFAWRVYDATVDEWYRLVFQRRFAYVDPKGTVPPEVHSWTRPDGVVVAEQWIVAEDLYRRVRLRFWFHGMRRRMREPFVRPDRLLCKIIAVARKQWRIKCGDGELTIATPLAAVSAARNGYDMARDCHSSWIGLYLGIRRDWNPINRYPFYAFAWVKTWFPDAPR